MRYLDRHSGQTALVTGGGSGIGLEFARLLAQSGWNLILVGRSGSKLEQAREELSSTYGISVEPKISDISRASDAEALAGEFASGNREVLLLINNAGSGLFGPAVEQSAEEMVKMISLNITGLTLLSTNFAAAMSERGRGYILNVGSLAGRTPMPYFAAYGATKSYVHNFSIALRAEVAKRGVVVSCLEPGYVTTSFDENARIENERYLKFSQRNGMSPRETAVIGLRALFRGKARVVPGFGNKIVAGLTSLIPPSWSARTVYGSVSKLIS